MIFRVHSPKSNSSCRGSLPGIGQLTLSAVNQHDTPMIPGISVLGLQSSDYRDRTSDLMRLGMEQMLRMFAEGTIAIPIDSTFSLDKAADALQAVKNGGIRGKLVLVTEPGC
jgi:NADPH:quinone reductase-like Zn-dependent oxidoreductase